MFEYQLKIAPKKLGNKWKEQEVICEVWQLYTGDYWSELSYQTDDFFVL